MACALLFTFLVCGASAQNVLFSTEHDFVGIDLPQSVAQAECLLAKPSELSCAQVTPYLSVLPSHLSLQTPNGVPLGNVTSLVGMITSKAYWTDTTGCNPANADNLQCGLSVGKSRAASVALNASETDTDCFTVLRSLLCVCALPATTAPTNVPTSKAPTLAPTQVPTSKSPTLAPTLAPTSNAPTLAPTSKAPTTLQPSGAVTKSPTTAAPTGPTTLTPTLVPSMSPSAFDLYVQSQPKVFPAANLTLSPSSPGSLGYSTSTSTDGVYAAIGVPYNNVTGSTLMYSRQGSQWNLIQHIHPHVINSATIYQLNFGLSVSLNQDGTVLAIGAQSYRFRGAVFLYQRQSGQYVAETVVTPKPSGDGNSFGEHVSLSPDGATLIASVYGASDGSSFRLVRRVSPGNWSAIQTIGVGFLANSMTALYANGFVHLKCVDDLETEHIFGLNASNLYVEETIAPTLMRHDTENQVYIFNKDSASILYLPVYNVTGRYVQTYVRNDTVHTWNSTGIRGPFNPSGYHYTFSFDGSIMFMADNTGIGAVHVYKDWTFRQTLVGTGALSDSGQGAAASSGGNGKYLVYGGPGDDSSNGAAWFFNS